MKKHAKKMADAPEDELDEDFDKILIARRPRGRYANKYLRGPKP